MLRRLCNLGPSFDPFDRGSVAEEAEGRLQGVGMGLGKIVGKIEIDRFLRLVAGGGDFNNVAGDIKPLGDCENSAARLKDAPDECQVSQRRDRSRERQKAQSMPNRRVRRRISDRFVDLQDITEKLWPFT